MAGRRGRGTTMRLSAGQAKELRALMSDISGRLQLGELAGRTFDTKRDMFRALGYRKVLTARDYLARYERSEIAERVVEALPRATWRGGAEVVEDDDPNAVTPFEEAWLALTDRLGIWDTFRRGDVLSRLGEFGIILIGAAGDYRTPLPAMRSQADVLYLTPYHETAVKIQAQDLVGRTDDARYGLPEMYTVSVRGVSGATTQKKVHWTRVIHLAENQLQSVLYGRPALRSIWNRLDDLEKVVGGGSEAFWQRVQPGYQVKVDRDVEFPPGAEAQLSTEIDEFLHGMRRYVRTRAVEMEDIGASQVARLDLPMDAIISLVSAGSSIPKRILMGSERGELASQQDRSNWDQTVSDRRDQFAAPQGVRALCDRLVSVNGLPAPERYDVRWPSVRNLDDDEIAAVAVKWATVNQRAGETVITPDEIRDRVLMLPPLEEVIAPALEGARRARRFLTKRGSRRASADAELQARVQAVVEASASGTDSVPMRAAMAELAALVVRRRTAAA